MTLPLVCFHAQCPDGYGSAWWLGKALGEHEKVACYYDQPFPDCTDREVYMVDFCPKADELRRVVAECASLMILDHHASQVAEVETVPEIRLFHSEAERGEALDQAVARWMDEGLTHEQVSRADPWRRCQAVMDMTRSGVGIVSQYTSWHHARPPDWFANLEDRDLWRLALPATPQIFAAITSFPYTDEAWDTMGDMLAIDLAREGRGIERYRQRLIEQTLETAHQGDLVGGGTNVDDEISAHFDIWMAACPYAICSDVAGELAKREPRRFAATYVDYGNRRKYSLRSVDPTGADVSVIAAQLDPTGGGHRHAAGAMVYL